jgi:hypothetical protein
MRAALLFIFIFVLAGCPSAITSDPGTAASATGAVSDAHVRSVLMPRHFDPNADAVRALGAAAAPTLIAIAEDASEGNAVRIRATLAMRHQSSEETKQALVRLATTSPLPALRRSSVDSLSRAFAARDAELVLATCVALRTHPDASVQRAASTAEVRARVHGARRPR